MRPNIITWTALTFFCFLSLLLQVQASERGTPKYSDVARCMFIYGAIFETGKNQKNNGVYLYGQKRLAWVGGYNQAQENNLNYQRAFQQDAERNKKIGISTQNRLTRALKTKDSGEYIKIMKEAKICDEKLGLSSNDLP